MSLGPQIREGELVFGVAHIFASFNDTFVHVTDLSGKETIVRITGTSPKIPYALFQLYRVLQYFTSFKLLLGVVVVVSDFGLLYGIEAYCRGHEG